MNMRSIVRVQCEKIGPTFRAPEEEVRDSGFKPLRELSFITGRGGRLFVGGGDQNFLGWSKGGTKIFSVGQRGGPEFFEGQRGGDQIFFSKIFSRLRRSTFLTITFKNFSRLRRNLSFYPTSCHIVCSYIVNFFPQCQDIYTLS